MNILSSGSEGAAVPFPDCHIVLVARDKLHAEMYGFWLAHAFPSSPIRVFAEKDDVEGNLEGRRADLFLCETSLAEIEWSSYVSELLARGLVDKVILLTLQKDQYTIRTLSKVAVGGVVDVELASYQELKYAITEVMSCRLYVSSSLNNLLLEELEAGRNTLALLTQTQQQVLSQIGAGYSNVNIAGNLGCSPATVQTHKRNIMKRLRVRNTPDLMLQAIRLGLVRYGRGSVIQPSVESVIPVRRSA